MSPQAGPDLVSAGYPTSSALTALLGGSANTITPNVPVYTNAYFPGVGGALTDVSGPGSAASGSVYTVAVPVVPGAVITKISWVIGATAAACVTSLWSAIYTGTGSAPGTTGAQPTLIASAATPATASTASTLSTFSFAASQTISSIQAPFGYIYAAFSVTTGAGSPNGLGYSLISTAAASAAMYQYFPTSPYSLFMTSNGGAGSAVPATIGAATRAANPPIVLLY